jgi:CRP/FNR family transcriptional regulator, cyclic AMP receptor protein
MSQSIPGSLRAVDLFKKVDDKTIRDLDRRCHWKRCAADEQIINYQDDSRDVYFIVSGVVRVVVYSSSGRCICLDDLTAGSVFGEIAAIDGRPRSASVVAATESLIASMPPEAFKDALVTYPAVAASLLERLAQVVRHATDRIIDLSTQGAACRVMTELVRMGRQNMVNERASILSPAPTQTDIASRVSTTRETVARVFADLTRQGILRKAPKTLYINDVLRLERLAGEAREASV